MADDDKLKRDDALVLALACGLTVRQAAGEAGFGERTAHRRLADPEFRRRVSAVRGELLVGGGGRLSDAATQAVDVLRELLDADADTIRLAAARTILQQSVALRTAAELEQRIARLEQSEGQHGNDSIKIGAA